MLAKIHGTTSRSVNWSTTSDDYLASPATYIHIPVTYTFLSEVLYIQQKQVHVFTERATLFTVERTENYSKPTIK